MLKILKLIKVDSSTFWLNKNKPEIIGLRTKVNVIRNEKSIFYSKVIKVNFLGNASK